MIPAKIYPLTIPANGSFPLLAIGDFFKIISATSTFEISGDTFGTLGEILPGQGMEKTPFTRLTFRDTSGASNLVEVLVAGEKFIDDRVTGDVSVIDGEKARTLAGAAFSWRCTAATGLGNRQHAQLWNPATSGKNLIIDGAYLAHSIGGSFVVGVYNTELSTAGQPIQNMNSGSSAATVALPRVQDIAAVTMTRTFGSSIGGTTFDVTSQLRRPIVVTPGFGLQLVCDVAGGTLTGMVTFFEENV